jgi:diaminopimelate epimerase
MRFEKWQALGNDYLIIEQRALDWELTPARISLLCRAHTGIGADGVLLIAAPREEPDVAEVRIFNPDGSEAELSGNGVREAVLYMRSRGWTDRDSFSINTAAGRIRPQITGPFTCRVDMGNARLSSPDFPSGPDDGLGELRLAVSRAGAQGGSAVDPRSKTPSGDERVWRFRHVSVGNPQCAIQVSDEAALEALDVGTEGPPIEHHPLFPNRTNVSWFAELERGPPARVRARIFERGVGETLSSGTGASGAAVAYLLSTGALPPPGGAAARVVVMLDGGELEVEVDDELRLHLSGWARPVFAGELSEEFARELEQTR